MTDANTANTHEIGELVARIRAWQLAREAHRNASPNQGGTWHAVQYAAKEVTGSFVGNERLLPAFVALADALADARAVTARALALEALLSEARAAMQVFRNPMDVPNTDISESLTIDYVCRKIDANTEALDSGEA